MPANQPVPEATSAELPATLDFTGVTADYGAWESMGESLQSVMKDALMTVATERMTGGDRHQRRALNRLERNGFMARLVTRRAHAKFAETADDPTDMQSFLEWLIANWESILKMVMSILALFGI